jgi:hypothetical protein
MAVVGRGDIEGAVLSDGRFPVLHGDGGDEEGVGRGRRWASDHRDRGVGEHDRGLVARAHGGVVVVLDAEHHGERARPVRQ